MTMDQVQVSESVVGTARYNKVDKVMTSRLGPWRFMPPSFQFPTIGQVFIHF